MDISIILLHGLIGSLLLTVALLFIGLKGPRIMLQDYPKSIQEATSPKSKQEKKQTFIYGWPFMAVMIFYPLAVGLFYNQQVELTFLQNLYLTWGILLFFNLYDLLILDWLMFCTITPKFIVIPGTEGNTGYKDYWFHFIGFIKGILITLILASLISLLITKTVVISSD
jgi:hypothetical protein